MEYIQPKTMKETLHVMNKWKGKATLIAGGTNILPNIRAKLINPNVLVDISHLKNLAFIKEDRQSIRIGGLTTISELASSKVIQKYASILSDAANCLGNPQVRNRATIAGNLADASPAADTPIPLLALEAVLVVGGEGRKAKEIPIDHFFLGPNQTVLKKDELIREITFLKPELGTKTAYVNLALRSAMAITLVSVAILMKMEGNQCLKARIGLGTVAPKPLRAYGVEEVLTSKEITEELIEICSERIQLEVHPNPGPSIRASAEYRRAMVSVLLKRAIYQALSAAK